MIEEAVLDNTRLQPFARSIDDYGVGDPDDPWANNCLARDSVAYSNGLIARADTRLDLRFDTQEFCLCNGLAIEAARVHDARASTPPRIRLRHPFSLRGRHFHNEVSRTLT